MIPQTLYNVEIYRHRLVVAFINGCIAGLITFCFMIYFENEVSGTDYE
jgi:hypothetical protein